MCFNKRKYNLRHITKEFRAECSNENVIFLIVHFQETFKIIQTQACHFTASVYTCIMHNSKSVFTAVNRQFMNTI